MKKIVLFISLSLVLTAIPTESYGAIMNETSSLYDATKATAFAKTHALDKGSQFCSKMKCAEFVCTALKEGGINVPNINFPSSTRSYDQKTHKITPYTNPSVASPALLVFLAKEGYEVIPGNKVSYDSFDLGDLVFMQGADHVVLITSFSKSGKPLYSGRNKNRLNEPLPLSSVSYLVKMQGVEDVTKTFKNKTIKLLTNSTNQTPLLFDNTFYCIYTSDGWIGLKAPTNKYLTVEYGCNGNMLSCRASRLESWQCFRIYKHPDSGKYLIYSQISKKFLNYKNSRYTADAKNVKQASHFTLLKIKNRGVIL